MKEELEFIKKQEREIIMEIPPPLSSTIQSNISSPIFLNSTARDELESKLNSQRKLPLKCIEDRINNVKPSK